MCCCCLFVCVCVYVCCPSSNDYVLSSSNFYCYLYFIVRPDTRFHLLINDDDICFSLYDN